MTLTESVLKPDYGCLEDLIHQGLFYGRAPARGALVERLRFPPWIFCEKAFYLR